MQLSPLDLAIVGFFLLISLVIGIVVTRRAGSSDEEFFLSGRTMPWWLLGASMVATTFSTDTPNLVADIVRQNGVAGNWVWWAFLLTGMLTVFIYAKLWRRSGVFTDIEFYELRYSGKPAAFLRGFRALYLGLLINGVIMASVCLAGMKIGRIMFGFSPLQSLGIALTITVIYSALGGLRGVLITDFIQFSIAMIGSVAAAVYLVRMPEIGGLEALLTHPNVQGKLSIFPDFSNREMVVTLLILPLAVQWWSVWYPGSEPGGGGYVAQRMLAAKNENHAIGATLLFNCAHYALRPWPWIIVALCSLVIFPTLDSIQTAFPGVENSILGDDLGYPAMLTMLPSGLLGLVVASLVAAFMSTISTQLNWGSSYITNDFWKRFVEPGASPRRLVMVGRATTVLLVLIAGLIALAMDTAKGAFDLIMQIGAGTGLIFILRWFWWRVNAWSEMTAILVSFFVAVIFLIMERTGFEFPGGSKLLIGVAVTTVAWIAVTFLTEPDEEETLRKFYRLTRPGGPGWKALRERAQAEGETLDTPGARWDVPMGILCMVLGCLAVYGALFATGSWLYGNTMMAVAMTITTLVSGTGLVILWKRIATQQD